jgi:hypothetical protein
MDSHTNLNTSNRCGLHRSQCHINSNRRCSTTSRSTNTNTNTNTPTRHRDSRLILNHTTNSNSIITNLSSTILRRLVH